MNHSSKQYRLSISAVLATFFLISMYALNSQPSPLNSSRGAEEGVIVQIEGIFSTSARHVFDEGYWIANMHSIRSSLY
jgi:hypothetical protein